MSAATASHSTPSLRCSETAAGQSLLGTAPSAAAWLIIEQDFPWPAHALTSDQLTAAARAAVAAAADAGARVLLTRDRARRAGVDRFWYAVPGRSSLRIGDLNALGAHVGTGGQLEGAPGADSSTPMLFICVNGKRDACCAVAGNGLVRALAHRVDVMECTHIGGHRFAATGLLLPAGDVHGRLDPVAALAVLESASRSEVHLATLRGSSALEPAAQVADAHVRSHLNACARDEVSSRLLHRTDTAATVLVRHRSGRAWEVALSVAEVGPLRESCNAEIVQGHSWRVDRMQLQGA